MNHDQIEKDIAHLEQIMARIAPGDSIPLSYWRNRINSVSSEVLVPAQVDRVKKLRAALNALEARQRKS
ncbi:MAG TPA: hypothetical protein VNE00_24430 [Paraburkholderia sp.]|jgi:hypothetical protein|nr:hypothetical protein [Paraburkholderia sp.]